MAIPSDASFRTMSEALAPGDIRLVCKAHNFYMAEKDYGTNEYNSGLD